MDWVYFLSKSAFVLLGIITVLVGKSLSVKFIIPARAKYKIIDEMNYINSSRLILYCLGLYYILLGIVLLVIKVRPALITYFATVIPAIIVMILSLNLRKYTK
jgi:hypothetical protein